MTLADYLLLVAIFSIWGLLLVNVALIIAGYIYYIKIKENHKML